jgi:hypothetical protein
MTREQFLDAARSHGIRRDAFSFDAACDECYVVAGHGDGWDVYYSERGLQSGRRHFAAESAALDDLLGRLRADPSTRARA